MKKIIILFCLSCLIQNIYAQNTNYTVLSRNVSITEKNINTVTIPAGKSTQIDPLLPEQTDPLAPFQTDPLIPAETDPLKEVIKEQLFLLNKNRLF